MGEDVLERIAALRRRRHNLKAREIEAVASAAGWVHDRTEGSHAIFVKEGFGPNLPIPRKIKGNLALRLLGMIEASIVQEQEEGR